MSPKKYKLWALKNFGYKEIFLVKNNVGSKKIFGFDPFQVQTKFGAPKKLLLKNPRAQTVGAKGFTKMLVKKTIGFKNVFGPNKFRPPKILLKWTYVARSNVT